MPPPPPPPPGPPPPPAMTPVGPIAKGSGGQPRDQLLSAIRHGTKLKKTHTVDKSGPLIAGKVTGGGVVESSRAGNNNSSPRTNGGPPALGGLFAGGMPKLRPTGLGSSPARDGPLKAPSTDSRNINRGPPPQPPPASHKPNQTNAPESTTTNPVTPRPAVPNKPPIGGYGKPNIAPRPPPPLAPNSSALHGAEKPSPPPKSLIVNGRPTVSRAQSMRVPRSPPVAPPSSTANGPLVSHLSQEGLNMSKTGTLPHNFHVHKLAPSPPGYRGAPTRAPITRPPPPPSRPAPPTTAPPPPPPHRSSPAPPPPRMPPAAPNSAPPAPPARNSSMRNGNTSAFLSELESRFSFHNVREFADPQPFRNVVKQYNTRAAANAKQQAPAPPPSQSSTHLQLSQKMWSSHASQC